MSNMKREGQGARYRGPILNLKNVSPNGLDDLKIIEQE
jgi:hypothetical protein